MSYPVSNSEAHKTAFTGETAGEIEAKGVFFTKMQLDGFEMAGCAF